MGIPRILQNNAGVLREVETRVCDDVMLHLSEIIVGLPEYHPLLKDAQARFDRNLRWLEHHEIRQRANREFAKLGTYSTREPLIIAFRPLTRPATAADVELGDAVFHFDGQGKVLPMKLPAWVALKKEAYKGRVHRHGFVFQAEEFAGVKQYGVLFSDGLRTVKEDEVLRFEEHEAAVPGTK